MKKISSLLLAIMIVISGLMIVEPLEVKASSTLLWPVLGHTSLTQGYVSGHKGIDISDGSISGAEIRAAIGGVVYKKYTCTSRHPNDMHNCDGIGTGLIIRDTATDTYYQYCHMQAGSIPSNINVGSTVSMGTVIGRVGNTGNTVGNTGIHLHFEIGQGSAWAGNINPSSLSYKYSLDPPVPTNPLLQLQVQDIGAEVYGIFLKNAGWMPIGTSSSNAQLAAHKSDDANLVWKFVKQSDASYVIYHCSTGQVLTAQNSGTAAGINVIESAYNGGNNQKWIIRGPWSGEFVFSPKSNTSLVLDVMNNGSTPGTNVCLANYNGSGAQKFAIYTQNVPDVGTSTLSCKAEDNLTTTKFTWTKAANATSYNLVIESGMDFFGTIKVNPESTRRFNNLTSNSFEVKLPAIIGGSYQAYIESCTFYTKKKSNVVKFSVSDAPRFNVTLDSNGGGPISPSLYPWPHQNKRFGELPTPTRAGYNFNGWYTAPSGGTKVTEDSICTSDCTLYAQWTEIVGSSPSPTPSTQPNTNTSGNITPTPSIQPIQKPSGDASTTTNNGSTTPSVSGNSKLVVQKIKVKVASKTYKYSKVKKKKQTFNIGVSGNKGKVSYTIPKEAKKYISVSSKGKVTIKKGTKKGTYKLTVIAEAKGKYKKATKTIVIKIK